MRHRFITMTLACTLAPLGPALALDLRQRTDLGNLYAQGVFEVSAFACTRRFPELGKPWAELHAAWRARHAAALAEMADLDAKLIAALQAVPPKGAPVSLDELFAWRTHGTVLILSALAAAGDAKARETCDMLRARITDDAPLLQAFDSARAAAHAALAELQAAPR